MLFGSNMIAAAQTDEYSEFIFPRYVKTFQKLHYSSFLCDLSEEDTLQFKTKFRLSYIPTYNNTASIISIEQIKRKVTVTYIQCSIEQDGSFKLMNTIIKEYGIQEWGDFLVKIRDAMFWHLNTNSIDAGLDGSQWLVEGFDRMQNRKHKVYTWAPDGSFAEIGKYLFRLSGVNTED